MVNLKMDDLLKYVFVHNVLVGLTWSVGSVRSVGSITRHLSPRNYVSVGSARSVRPLDSGGSCGTDAYFSLEIIQPPRSSNGSGASIE